MNMVTRLGFIGCALLGGSLFACTGSTGPQGPAGPQGEPGTAASEDGGLGAPSAGTIVPNVGLIGRELDVQLSADNVVFDASSTVSFGAGVTVSNLNVVSATTLSAHLKIDPATSESDVDVTYTAGTATFVAHKGFHIEAPLGVTQTGELDQGGIGLVTLSDRDTHAFDTGTYSDPNNIFNTLSNFEVSAPGLTQLEQITLTSTDGVFAFLADPLATPGPVQFTAANAPNGTPLLAFTSDDVSAKITARAPITLTANTASASQNLAAPFASGLYKFTTTATTQIVTVVVDTGTSTKLVPNLYATKASGKFSDLLGVATQDQTTGIVPNFVFPSTTATDSYFVVTDASFGGGAASAYGYTIETQTVPATAVAESSTAHGDATSAQDLGALPAIQSPGSTTAGGSVVTGTIGTDTEVDVYKFTSNGTDNLEIALLSAVDAELVINKDGATFDETGSADPTVQPLQVFAGLSTVSDATTTGAPAAQTWYVCVHNSGGGTAPTGSYTFSIRQVQ